MTFNVFPFEHVAVFWWQPVQCYLDQAQRLNTLVVTFGTVRDRSLERVDGGLYLGKVLDKNDVVPITPLPSQPVGYLIAANRAQPRKHGRLGTVGVHLLHGSCQYRLHDFPRAFRIIGEPRHRESIQSRKVVVEKLIERAGVASK